VKGHSEFKILWDVVIVCLFNFGRGLNNYDKNEIKSLIYRAYEKNYYTCSMLPIRLITF